MNFTLFSNHLQSITVITCNLTNNCLVILTISITFWQTHFKILEINDINSCVYKAAQQKLNNVQFNLVPPTSPGVTISQPITLPSTIPLAYFRSPGPIRASRALCHGEIKVVVRARVCMCARWEGKWPVDERERGAETSGRTHREAARQAASGYFIRSTEYNNFHLFCSDLET